MPFGEQPAYLRVAADLRKKIIEGDLLPGARLPSQKQIREDYDVSDTVALEARKILIVEGFVEGRSGSGTYVRERTKPQRLARSGLRPIGRSTPFRQEQADEASNGTWQAESSAEQAAPCVAERLRIEAGDRVMRTRYVFRTANEPVMLSTSWEPLAVTGRTPVMLPEEGPVGGRGVVERMSAIDIVVDNVVEEVTARPCLAEEATALGGVAGHVVLVIHRTYFASDRPVETADIVVPSDRFRLSYHLPVR
ncbi:GntR family transcriptional regulator [Wenjunlia tyrosinilytica]|uniref:GntR family transcriptional regulator n=1 Tax=Wenjunlia tyrosinilytica TaxID=1544741 RepID=A0A917ZWM6_9ACTN|nr:GntR family transcriptional regulator [Wenjunlia tyrosinilytica]GGO97699.1 GntR family transcriptional regulator [Wenjunlia tyrosinilytica]